MNKEAGSLLGITFCYLREPLYSVGLAGRKQIAARDFLVNSRSLPHMFLDWYNHIYDKKDSDSDRAFSAFFLGGTSRRCGSVNDAA